MSPFKNPPRVADFTFQQLSNKNFFVRNKSDATNLKFLFNRSTKVALLSSIINIFYQLIYGGFGVIDVFAFADVGEFPADSFEGEGGFEFGI